MRAPLWRRVLMMFFGVPGEGHRDAPPVPCSAEHPLRRRVVAGLLGVRLEGTPAADTEERAVLTDGVHTPSQESYAVGELPALVLSAAPERMRRGGGFMRAVLAGAVGVAAVGGVALGLTQWQSEEPELTGPGAVVDIGTPLDVGDCVVAVWPGSVRFEGVPRLTEEFTCAAQTDGQVLAVIPAATAAEARREGPAKCAQRTRKVREKLPDVRGFAVVPTPATFRGAGRVTSCLVLGAHGPVYGPLDGYRKPGYTFSDTANMQKGDCLDVLSNQAAFLAACSQPHDQVVLGFAWLGPHVTFAEARVESDLRCARDVPPSDHGYDPSAYTAGSWVSEFSWESGPHYVVCTARKTDGTRMEPSNS